MGVASSEGTGRRERRACRQGDGIYPQTLANQDVEGSYASESTSNARWGFNDWSKIFRTLEKRRSRDAEFERR